MKIAVIYGSSRPSKAGETVAKYFAEQVQLPEDVELEFVDLKAVDLPLIADPMPPIMGQYEQESTKKWAERISGFDGFIFTVAEYNLGYTPILKNALDTLFSEWSDKPAALLSYGAYPKSAAVMQLKDVMKPLKINVVNEAFHVSPMHEAVGGDGKLDSAKVVGDSPQDVLNAVVALIK